MEAYRTSGVLLYFGFLDMAPSSYNSIKPMLEATAKMGDENEQYRRPAKFASLMHTLV